jgi:uncharacterized membrane protein (DUF485 family)
MTVFHAPAAQASSPDDAAAYKRRLGLIMLAVCAVVYIAFILINVISPDTMGTTVAGGISLAIVYGFALIVIAFALAVVYNIACTRHEHEVSLRKRPGSTGQDQTTTEKGS